MIHAHAIADVSVGVLAFMVPHNGSEKVNLRQELGRRQCGARSTRP